MQAISGGRATLAKIEKIYLVYSIVLETSG